MADLIDRQEAINAIVKESHKDGAYGYVDASDATKVINALPSAERHGKWIFGTTMGHSWMKCSECCKCQSGQTACFTYCPNCGARMDGE